MAISKDLFLAILSMDAYNEGYGAGLKLPAGTSQIGSATVGPDSTLVLRDPTTNQLLDQPAGIYAVACDTSNVTGLVDSNGMPSFEARYARTFRTRDSLPAPNLPRD
jgi:hypothetical protein